VSKAFVKETDEFDSDEDLGHESEEIESEGVENSESGSDAGGERSPKVPVKNYISPAGFARLTQEMTELLNVERPRLVETVAWAASNGDRSENADYIYGKRRLREIDRRIRFLRSRIDRAEVVDPKAQLADRVLFGAKVRIEFESGEQKQVQILGADETDPSRGKISWSSPIGRALLQGRVGDIVQVKTPRGFEELEILEILYGAGDSE